MSRRRRRSLCGSARRRRSLRRSRRLARRRPRTPAATSTLVLADQPFAVAAGRAWTATFDVTGDLDAVRRRRRRPRPRPRRRRVADRPSPRSPRRRRPPPAAAEVRVLRPPPGRRPAPTLPTCSTATAPGRSTRVDVPGRRRPLDDRRTSRRSTLDVPTADDTDTADALTLPRPGLYPSPSSSSSTATSSPSTTRSSSACRADGDATPPMSVAVVAATSPIPGRRRRRPSWPPAARHLGRDRRHRRRRRRADHRAPSRRCCSTTWPTATRRSTPTSAPSLAVTRCWPLPADGSTRRRPSAIGEGDASPATCATARTSSTTALPARRPQRVGAGWRRRRSAPAPRRCCATLGFALVLDAGRLRRARRQHRRVPRPDAGVRRRRSATARRCPAMVVDARPAAGSTRRRSTATG